MIGCFLLRERDLKGVCAQLHLQAAYDWLVFYVCLRTDFSVLTHLEGAEERFAYVDGQWGASAAAGAYKSAEAKVCALPLNSWAVLLNSTDLLISLGSLSFVLLFMSFCGLLLLLVWSIRTDCLRGLLLRLSLDCVCVLYSVKFRANGLLPVALRLCMSGFTPPSRCSRKSRLVSWLVVVVKKCLWCWWG